MKSANRIIVPSKTLYRVRDGVVQRRRIAPHPTRSSLAAPTIMMAAGWIVAQRSSSRRVGFGGPADPWASLDGRQGATPGVAPQYPSILNSYVTSPLSPGRYRWPSNAALVGSVYQQPQWQVAGVDYAVGAPATGLTTVDAAYSPPSGVVNDFADRFLKVTGSNVVLDHLDFATNGYHIDAYNGGTSLSITNSTFKGPDLIRFEASAGGVFGGTAWGGGNNVIKNCTLDGNSQDGGLGSNLILMGNGNYDIEYNWLKNSAADNLHLDDGNIVKIKYNISENPSMSLNPTVHGDTLQIEGGNLDIVVQFNTVVTTAFGAGGTQGYWIGANPGAPTFNSVDLGWNCFARCVAMAQCAQFGPSFMNCVGQVHDNYVNSVDSTFGNGGPFQHEGFIATPGPFSGSAVCHDNVDLNSGTKPSTVGWQDTISGGG